MRFRQIFALDSLAYVYKTLTSKLIFWAKFLVRFRQVSALEQSNLFAKPRTSAKTLADLFLEKQNTLSLPQSPMGISLFDQLYSRCYRNLVAMKNL